MNGLASMLSAIGVVLFAYAAGSIPWGFLIGKFNGLDLRRHGSGNIGATNVKRVIGKDWAALCLTLDVLKGLVPVLVALKVGSAGDTPFSSLVPIVTAFASVAGHIWPFTLGFKGGKGVATSLGALVALAPWPVLAAIVTWFVVLKTSRYVSVASISGAIMLLLSGIIECVVRNGKLPWSTVVLLAILCVTVVVRHRSNLSRLRQGTEPRIGHSRDKRSKNESSRKQDQN